MPTPISWTWDYGDGHTGSGQVVNHQYAAGRYMAKLTVVDDAGASSDRTIMVHAFEQERLGIIAQQWELDDGHVQSGPQAIHTFPTAGHKTVGLYLQNQQGDHDYKAYPVGVWDRRLFYKWNFGDGTIRTEIDDNVTEHQFTRPGQFTVNLEMYDLWQRAAYALALSCAGYGIMAIPIPESGRVPLDVGFDALMYFP